MNTSDTNQPENSTESEAHAYQDGTEIHIGPGEEKHLPHEAWHVVQQKQGRVRPTVQMEEENADQETGD